MLNYLLLFAVVRTATNHVDGGVDLDRYVNQFRLLVVLDAPGQEEEFRRQRKLMSGQGKNLAERDLLLLSLSGVTADQIRRQRNLPRGKFATILVGKDGGTKFVSAEPVPATRIFEIVDAMPMRQAELREARSRKGRS